MSGTGRGAPPQSAVADREIVICRVIDAPPELVFEAFTEVRHLSRWWGPDGFSRVGALAVGAERKHNASMPNVLVRDVPDDVHAALQRKAEQRHQSLQQYLIVELRQLAEHRSISEVLDDVETQHGGRVGLATAVQELDEERSLR